MKKVVAITSALSLSLISYSSAFAQYTVTPCDPTNKDFGHLCNLQNSDPSKLLSNIIIGMLIAAVVIALIFLIWGGIKWILSGGDKAGVEGARAQIVGSIIGLVIAFAAFFVINIISQIFLGHPITGLTLPTF